ncbi:MAG: recombination-associated protein RdgC [Holophagales bacterium]|jgi:DNA recombination-dependent growth factor C|nr:recombination-associated protein RdgC [Holophagales bacterium]
MGLLQGTLSLRRFLALGPVPDEEELCRGLEQGRYRPFEDGMEEERHGWVDWRNPLVTPADSNHVFQGRFAVFALRVDTRKVPPMLLKAHTDLRIQNLMKEKDLAFVGREARISLQDEVRAELLRQVLPTPRIVEVAWDIKGGLVWTTAGNSKAQSHLMSLCMKSFGVELQPLAPLLLAGRLAPNIPTDVLVALEPFDLSRGDV